MLRRRRQITQRTTSTAASTILNPYSRTSQDADSSSSDNDEEEEEILLRRQEEQEEEAEQERLLSERHGEANESPSSPSSPSFKRQSDAEIANELNQTSVPKKKKPRMNLTTAQLVSPEGLIRIRHEFGKIQYRPPRHDPSVRSKEKRLLKEVQASGVYLNRLIHAYERFAMDIAPNMHYSDTFRKIQDLGGKKEVRDYLNTMRQEICKEHLQKIYGKERAEKFLDELEHRQQSSRDGQIVGAVVQEEEKESNDEGDDDNVDDIMTNRQGDQVSKESQNDASKKAQRRRSDDSDDEEDYEASFDDVQPSIALKSVHSDAHETNEALQSTNNNSNTTIHDDQDEEEPIAKQANDYGGDEFSDDLEEPCADSTNDFFGNDNAQKDDTSPSSNYEEEESSSKLQEEEKVDDHDVTSMKSTNPIDISLGIEEINKDPTSNDDTSNQAMECFHTQEDSTHPSMFQSQENVAMTQDTAAMLGISSSSSFSLGQTQGMSQETLVVNVTSSLTQTQPEYEATQDTLILDVSQEMGNTQNTCNDAGGSGSSGGGCSGSQDY